MLERCKSKPRFCAAFMALLIVGLFLRTYRLAERPLHHDEAQHAYYSLELAQKGSYHYVPFLHGPVLYMTGAVGFKLLGDSDFTARLMPALAGNASAMLPLALAPWLGTTAAWIAATMLTLSPTFVYYSRFLRHDVYSILLHLLMLLGWLIFWRHQKSVGLYLLVGAAVLSY